MIRQRQVLIEQPEPLLALREPDLHLGFVLGPFSMGQILSAPMVMLGAFMLVWGYHKRSLEQARSLTPPQ